MDTEQARTQEGLFKRRRLRDPVELYDGARAVATAWADAESEPVVPEQITQRDWNATKRSLPEWDWLPNANEICRQLGVDDRPLPWRELLRIAFDDERGSEPVHRAITATPSDETIGDERVFFSMRRIALEIGKASLSSLDYRDGYDLLIAKDRRARNGSRLANRLLTFSQVYEYVEWDWSRACAIAEFDPPARARGVPNVDALIRLYRVTGSWCSQPRLLEFAQDHGFALATRPRKPWPEVIEEARSVIRAEDGVEPPPYVPRQAVAWEKPSEPMLEPGDMPALTNVRYVRPELVLHMIRFLEQLRRGERPTHGKYETFARTHGAPSLSTVEGHGGLAQLIREAKKPGARERAQAELDEIRNPTPEQKARQERLRNEERASDPRAQTLLDAIRTLGSPTPAQLLAHAEQNNASIRSSSAVQHWLEPLRATGQVKAVPGNPPSEIRYVLASEETTTSEAADPGLLRKATTPTCRRIHALLVTDGPAESVVNARNLGIDRSTTGKRLMRLVRAGFASAEMTRSERQGRSFTYTATSKPMPAVVEAWSESRWRVYDAAADLGEVSLGQITQHTGLKKNVITQHLFRLVRDGYFERIPGAHARRGTYRITGKAMPMRPASTP